jgi:N-acetylglucosamine-6-phosphate deacetylase
MPSMTDSILPLVLENATAITPFRREPQCTLILRGGKIAFMGRADDAARLRNGQRLDLTGHYVLPGFIDLHLHGGYGYDFADERPQAVDEISRFHASGGTTSMIATLYAQPVDRFKKSIRRLREYCESAGPHRILEGIHLEGPFLNPELHGAIPAENLCPGSIEVFRELVDAGGPWVRVMTIAPEMPGAMDVLREAALVHNGHDGPEGSGVHPLHMSIGHSRATYEQIAEAIDNGLDGVTHIFNAMVPMHHRKPGVLAGTLLRDELFVEVIADTFHVHPAVLQLLMKIKNYDKIILVTDAIRAAGQPDLSHAPDTLAGSTLTMDAALRTMITHAGASLEQAAQMASLNAARVLAWKYRRGILAVGKDADLAVLDSDLRVKMTVKAGKVVWQA